MLMPEFTSADDVLEYAAQLIEQVWLLDLSGVAARRKRDREDAALRVETIKKTRKECAAHIRAFKNRPDLDAVTVLERLSRLDDDHMHSAYLRDAWPLAWKGWVNIECRICCNSNSIPPSTEYRIIVTDRGRRVLEKHAKAREEQHGAA